MSVVACTDNEQKIRCFEAVQRADVSDEERYLLANVVHGQLELDDEEAARFEAEVRSEGRREVGEMIQTFSEALADRETRGRNAGRLEECRNAIALVAKRLHKQLPGGFEEKLDAIDNLERLHEILDRVTAVSSLDEIGLEPTHS